MQFGDELANIIDQQTTDVFAAVDHSWFDGIVNRAESDLAQAMELNHQVDIATLVPAVEDIGPATVHLPDDVLEGLAPRSAWPDRIWGAVLGAVFSALAFVAVHALGWL